MAKQAVILAGGAGLKLRPLTFSQPKPLLCLLNKPILDYVIFLLKQAGITQIILTADYLADQLQDYLANNNFGITIEVHVLKNYHGTAQILKELEPKLEQQFLVLPGDCLYDLNLGELIQNCQVQKATLGLVARQEVDLLGKGGLIVEQGQLKAICRQDENKDQALSDAWIYYMDKQLLDLIPSDKNFDIHLDLIQAALATKQNIYVMQMDGFWAVIGRIHPYIAANFWVLQNIGTNTYVGANSKIATSAKLIAPYFIGENCLIADDAEIGPNAIIGKGVSLGTGVKLDNTIVQNDSVVGELTQIKNSLVAANCQIGARCKIGRLAIIANNCVLGDDCTLEDGARIGPNIQIKAGTSIADFLFPKMKDETYSKKTDQSELNSLEQEICLQLKQAGEQTFVALLATLKTKEADLKQCIERLMAKKILLSAGKTPIVYFLSKD